MRMEQFHYPTHNEVVGTRSCYKMQKANHSQCTHGQHAVVIVRIIEILSSFLIQILRVISRQDAVGRHWSSTNGVILLR